MLNALQLKKSEFAEIHLLPNLNLTRADSENTGIAYKIGFVADAVDDSQWMARLRVELTPPQAPLLPLYTGVLEVIATFSLSATLPLCEHQKTVCCQGGALLFSMVRELVLNLTTRSIHGQIMLPDVDPSAFLSSITSPKA